MQDKAGSTLVADKRRSRSYLLRLWQEEPACPWRALLRSVSTQEERLFQNLEELVAFLDSDLGKSTESGTTPPRQSHGGDEGRGHA
jgi:hypothetical protein